MPGQQDLFVVEYSISQGAWHIDDLMATLDRNMRWCLDGESEGNDYKIVGLAKSYEEAQAIKEKLQSIKEKPTEKRG